MDTQQPNSTIRVTIRDKGTRKGLRSLSVDIKATVETLKLSDTLSENGTIEPLSEFLQAYIAEGVNVYTKHTSESLSKIPYKRVVSK